MQFTSLPDWAMMILNLLALGGMYAVLVHYITHVADVFKRVLTWSIIPAAIAAFFAVTWHMEAAVIAIGGIGGLVCKLAIHFNMLALLGPELSKALLPFASLPWYSFVICGLFCGLSASGIYKQNKAGQASPAVPA